MTLLPPASPPHGYSGHADAWLRITFWLTLAFAWLLGARMGLEVWRNGYFADTDDAMRMTQVRDFIAGQGWYDIAVKRLGEAPGLTMHWTRIADVPVAFLVWLFSFAFDGQSAERAARLATPALLLAALFVAMRILAPRLLPPLGVAATLVIIAFSGLGATQFAPGRIDHHALQIVLLACIVLFSIRAISSQHTASAATAMVLMSASLAISIENLPFIAAGFAIWPLLYIYSSEYAKQLKLAGLAGLVTLPIALGMFVAPSNWSIAHCDAHSPAYLMPMLAACLIFFALGTAGRRLSKLHRTAAVTLAGAVCLVIFAVFFPACLKGPLHAVDPFLRDYWLNNVAEARGFFAALRFTPQDAISTFAPLIAGTIVCALAAIFADGEHRLRWLAVCVFATAGAAASIWQIRAAASLAPVAALGGGWAAARLFDMLLRRAVSFSAVYTLSFSLLFSVMIWNVLTKPFFKAAVASPPGVAQTSTPVTRSSFGQLCFRSEIFDTLAKLPSGLVLAPIDSGAHILAHTHHRVLAAAYHRNNAGNRQAIEVFLGSPEQAVDAITKAGVDYIAICDGGSEMELLKLRAPNGFAAQLQRGVVPAWLERLPVQNQTLLIFKILSR